MSIKIIAILISLFSIHQFNQINSLSNELLKDQEKADSLENIISINDSIIMSIKSEYLIALKQVHKDSINVENFKQNKPTKLKGLNRNEINNKFSDYFKSKRSK
jgi:hypothetical protein